MLIKKIAAVLALLLILTLVIASCGGNTPTTNTTTTKTIPPATTTTPAPTTTAPTTTTAAATIPTGPPVVSAGDVTNITLSNAMLNASIEEGQIADKEGFDWGMASGNYIFTWEQTGDFGSGAFNHYLSGLTGGTIYYFRAKAHNSQGWGYSAEKTFRTLGVPVISGITPDFGLVGNTAELTITGIDFTGATAVNLGDGITVTKFTVDSTTQITAAISIKADTITGARTVSVTTDLGTGTMAGGFIVKKVSQVKHIVVWTDSQFAEIFLKTAPTPDYAYEVHFHDNNQMTLITTRSFTLWVELRGDKLCFTNVQQSAWDDLFDSGSQYMSYDSAAEVMTINTLPDVVLNTLFDIPLEVLPGLTLAVTAEGQITVNYYVLEETI